MIKQYFHYLRDNPRGYWFKRKLYGWGWVPVSWQGWLVIAALIVAIVLAAKYLLAEGKVIEYFLVLAVSVTVVFILGYLKGEKPRWQWGLPKNKK